ncbi:VOC family protein [Phytomonospora endophytica]|uniref:Catechol 2,3-dioxygenase-like lactoylglutathione lyase family enzyme n=1 Tax=Phytomonospora endophytica TaxID=714109 RepID=A0A841FM98_9ACTN|nr:VOC family protein [Phytomonospora endophytica]MBB6036984.1 catechol 2,3-dioxygenase-like lactoylglutathione lyase family enzyme [Phytomonospora endophytica]
MPTIKRSVTTLPAGDLERAKSWYAENLGLKPTAEDASGLVYELDGGTKVCLFPSTGRASGDHTQVSFDVEDLEAEVNGLKANGVEFEDYDLPGFTTRNSIFTEGDAKAAWLHDSEGNMICLSEGQGY